MCSLSQAEMEQEARRLSQGQQGQPQLVQVSPEVSPWAGRGGLGAGWVQAGRGKQKCGFQKCEGQGWEGEGWQIEDINQVSFMQ